MKRELPHDINAEQGFLCSAMNSNKIISKTVDRVNKDHFHFDANKHIWQTIVDMWYDKKAIDLLLNIRLQAKQNKDWATSDKIRNELTALGFEIKDTKDGFEWKI